MGLFNRLFSKKNNMDAKTDYTEVIFKLYYKTAYRAAYYYCGNAEIAEEAAQETMAKVLQNIDQLKDPEKIEAWIKKIAVNTTITMFNQRKKIVNIENVTLLADTIENSPEYIVDFEDTCRALEDALQSLDEISMQVIHLKYYEQMKIKDIASLLDKPEGTIKTLLHRAKLTLRKRLIRKGYLERPLQQGGVVSE